MRNSNTFNAYLNGNLLDWANRKIHTLHCLHDKNLLDRDIRNSNIFRGSDE
jgi:hypothetical protein